MAPDTSGEGSDEPELWLRFLFDLGSSQGRPGLYLRSDAWQEVPLSERTRAFLAAVAIPRHLAQRATAAQVSGDRWRSGEIVDRMVGYSNRASLHHALADLREKLASAGLDADDYLIPQPGGYYEVRELRVDVVELILGADSPDRIDKLLAICAIDPARFGLSPAHRKLLSDRSADQLTQVLRAAAARGAGNSAPAALDDRTEVPDAIGEDPAPPSEDDHPNFHAPARAAGRGRAQRVVAVVVVTLVVVAVLIGVLTGGGRTSAGTDHGRVEVVGGPARTWSNPQSAGGQNGPPLYQGMRISITCRLRGFQVQDGDIWWYRLGSSPWAKRYYATADAFYNNGRTSGPLKGSAFVDRSVRICR